MVKKIVLGCALPLVIVGALAWAGTRSILHRPPKPTAYETVKRGDVEVKVVETGAVQALRRVEVKSKVGGRLSKLFVDEGTLVRQGQILATIEPQEINSQVAALRAQLAGAQARLAGARKGAIYQTSTTSTSIEQYRQALISARARLAQATREAHVQPGLTGESIDIARANLESARSALATQEANYRLMTASTHPQAVVSAQSAYDQAQAQSENAARSVKRQRQLVDKGFVAQSVLDTALTDQQIADARLSDARQRLRQIQQTNAIEEATARTQVAGARSQVRQVEAALRQARSSVLPQAKQSDLEAARAAVLQAQAQYESARAGRTQDAIRQDDTAAAAAAVQQLENQLSEQLVHQRDTTLIAATSGVITKRYVEQGDLITSAIGSFSQGQPVFQISNLDTLLVKININEVDISKVRVGMLTEVTTDAAPGIIFAAHVSKVAPAAASDPAAQAAGASSQGVIRFPVEVRIDRPDTRLRPGMSARCALIAARRKGVLRIPAACVTGAGDAATVVVVSPAPAGQADAQRTTVRHVTAGLKGDEWVEIKSGLNAGERVRPSPFTGPARQEIDFRG